jgi:hypothetical protein
MRVRRSGGGAAGRAGPTAPRPRPAAAVVSGGRAGARELDYAAPIERNERCGRSKKLQRRGRRARARRRRPRTHPQPWPPSAIPLSRRLWPPRPAGGGGPARRADAVPRAPAAPIGPQRTPSSPMPAAPLSPCSGPAMRAGAFLAALTPRPPDMFFCGRAHLLGHAAAAGRRATAAPPPRALAAPAAGPVPCHHRHGRATFQSQASDGPTVMDFGRMFQGQGGWGRSFQPKRGLRACCQRPPARPDPSRRIPAMCVSLSGGSPPRAAPESTGRGKGAGAGHDQGSGAPQGSRQRPPAGGARARITSTKTWGRQTEGGGRNTGPGRRVATHGGGRSAAPAHKPLAHMATASCLRWSHAGPALPAGPPSRRRWGY